MSNNKGKNFDLFNRNSRNNNQQSQGKNKVYSKGTINNNSNQQTQSKGPKKVDTNKFKTVKKWISAGEFGKNNKESNLLLDECKNVLINSSLTSTKLREYYQEVKNIFDLYEEAKDSGQVKLKLYLLLSKMNYDYSRLKNPSIIFVNGFEELLNALFDNFNEQKFIVLKIWFETLVAVGKTVLKK